MRTADNPTMAIPNLHRRLVAILAADAVGYSRLMSVDDSATVHALATARSEFHAQICAYSGRVVDTAGDSVLAVFGSAASAVLAAQALQQQLLATQSDVAPDRRLLFRIGIHSGDVIEQTDGTVYGDGVNIAARLQTLAEAGGITVSQAIHDAVHGRIDAQFIDMGDQDVKNIVRPVHVYRIGPSTKSSCDGNAGRRLPARAATLLAAVARARRPLMLVGVIVGLLVGGASYLQIQRTRQGGAAALAPGLPARSPLSIVVLPFDNLTNDAELSRLARGLTASITAELTRIPGGFVVNAGTSPSLEGKANSSKQEGMAPVARFVLMGNIQRSGSKLRISAQLTDASSSELIWTDIYEGEDADPLSLQDRVARRITNSVDREMAMRAMRASQQASARPSVDDLMAQGNAFDHLEITSSNCQKVESIYRRVLILDPTNTKAQQLLAEWLSIHVQGFWQEIQVDERERMLGEAYRLATQASGIDPDSWQVNATFGNIAVMRGDWDGAKRAWERNVLRHPKASQAYNGLANVYLLRGEPQRAIEVLDKALALGPEDAREGLLALMAQAQLMAGNNAAAIKFALKARVSNPTDDEPILAMAYALVGDRTKARAEVASVLSANPKFTSSSWIQALPPEVAMRPEYLDYERRVFRPALVLAGFPR